MASHPAAIEKIGENLSATSSLCVPGTGERTCTFDLPLAAGTYDLVFGSYDAPVGPTGSVASTTKALASATVTASVIAGATNPVGVALQPIVRSIIVDGAGGPGPLYSGGSFGANAFDADGNFIDNENVSVTNGSQTESDTYANPVTVTIHDPSASTTMSLDGALPAKTLVLNSSLDLPKLSVADTTANYSAYVVATASGATSGSERVGFFFVSSDSPSFTYVTNPPSMSIAAGPPGSDAGISFSPGAVATSTSVVEDAGTKACPSGALALQSLGLVTDENPFSEFPFTPTFGSGTVTLVGYGDARCTLAFSNGSDTLNLAVDVTGTVAPLTGKGVHVLATLPTGAVASYNAGNPMNAATSAISSSEHSIARDAQGNTFLASFNGKTDTIEKFSAGTPLTGSPVATINTGNDVEDLAIDAAGHVYAVLGDLEIAEYRNDLTGTLATLSGSTAFGMSNPYLIDLDSSGNLDVAARYGLHYSKILVFSPLASGANDGAPKESYENGDEPVLAMAPGPGGKIYYETSSSSPDVPAEIDEVSGTPAIKTGRTASALAVVGNRLFVSFSAEDIIGDPQIPPHDQTPSIVYYDVTNVAKPPVPFITLGANAVSLKTW